MRPAYMVILLAFLHVVTGCAYYEDRPEVPAAPHVVEATMHGDANFSPAERATIESSAGAWGAFTNGRARLHIVWDYTDVTFLELASKPHIRRLRPEDVESKTTAGWEYNETDIALMPDRCPIFMGCALHELGHFLGLAHVTEDGCVMSAWNPPSSFQPADLAECIRVGLCVKPRPKDVTTVTVTVDPAIPRIDPTPPGW